MKRYIRPIQESTLWARSNQHKLIADAPVPCRTLSSREPVKSQLGATTAIAFSRAWGACMCYVRSMTSKVLAQAIEKAHELPDADQDRIGRELDDYVEGLRRLRGDLDQGIKSLDAGLGKELDIEDVIARANALHARA